MMQSSEEADETSMSTNPSRTIQDAYYLLKKLFYLANYESVQLVSKTCCFLVFISAKFYTFYQVSLIIYSFIEYF